MWRVAAWLVSAAAAAAAQAQAGAAAASTAAGSAAAAGATTGAGAAGAGAGADAAAAATAAPAAAIIALGPPPADCHSEASCNKTCGASMSKCAGGPVYYCCGAPGCGGTYACPTNAGLRDCACNAPPPPAAGGCCIHRVANDYYRLGVTVGDAALGGHTYLSELSLNQDHFARSVGFGWTANLAFNYSQHLQWTNRGRLGGTALVTVNGSGASTWHAPLGGKASLVDGGARLIVRGIALGTAATETWTISLSGAKLDWVVERTMGPEAVVATCDRGPTIVFDAEYTTTGHVLRTSAQVPSFLDADLQWDPGSGLGFQCHISGVPANPTTAGEGVHAPTAAAPGFWTEAITNRTSQKILLSPSSMQLTATASIAAAGDGTASSPLYFALSYPTTPGTGGSDTTMALGTTTIKPPSTVTYGSPDIGPWGSFLIAEGGSAEYYVAPFPHNTSKHHIVGGALYCGKSCIPSMPKTCTGAAPVPAGVLAALPEGAPFSCDMVPKNATGGSGTELAANAVHRLLWTMELEDGHGVAPFVLSTGDDDFDYNMHMFADVYNMWAGNIFGNSPASIVCLHEMSWFSQIASAFDSAPSGSNSVHSALEAELRMFAKHAIQPDGFVYARWNQWAYINMTIHDQLPHYILCNYWQVVNTGNREFLADVWPALNRVMEYVLRVNGMGMGMRADGLATTPTAHGLPGEDHADNWLDIINFGGKDAIINSYLITALSAMAEMAVFLGGPHASEAPKWRALHTKAVTAFNAQLWNESAGLYSDWIDTQGGRRNYFYVSQSRNNVVSLPCDDSLSFWRSCC